MRRLATTLLVGSLSFVLFGCTTVSQEKAAVRVAACPEALHYKYTSLPLMQGTAYDTEDGWIVKRVQESWREEQAIVQARRRPTAAEWEQFGRVLSELRVWEWRREYSLQDIGAMGFDGNWWEFSCRFGSSSLDSHGSNAYPKHRDPQKTTLDAKSLRRVERALEQLMDPKHESSSGT